MQQNQFTDSKIWDYCLETTSDLSDTLLELANKTRDSVHGSQMLSEKIVTKLLQMLVFTNQAKLCVDVGTYTGMSAIAMAEASPSAKVITIDRPNQAGQELADFYISKYTNIESIVEDAITALPKLPDNIDVAFIDADKKQTQSYFDILLPKLSNNGIIVVDDVLWRGEVVDSQDKRAKALDDFNRNIKSRKDVESLVLPIRHGVNIIRKKS
ncbi:O-methyltransferase [Francisella adeliensis]|uniref:Methyltransferase n=1 Tax=Francisella adeliensis TaxID=2007306 RepID=A0A2Z4XX69_9GAMM|nr:class I SAM-dependent methyltransferase [Francisella adeliensis]AXA33487.1 methyltransferase [Francisella adeliensis]MBK2084816.1 class I SAM-dependent methyltransferase [Francisella adeliensis]MBK2097241.1 class I SAM-dependent methyltransferase [Francisella adeliensis]QIW11718.1 O-methyltransferase [Francisella adeliensis]QIW13592.1 O-methyltransferase [Francisella adeliensis]